MLYLNPCPKRITHPLTQKEPLMDIDWKLHVLTYTVYRKHYQFTFKKHYDQLSKIMSWKEFGFKKGDLVFVLKTMSPANSLSSSIKVSKLLYKTTFFVFIESSAKGPIYHDGYIRTYIPLARKRFLNAKIVLDRFHITHHLGRVFLKTRFRLWTNLIRSHYPIVP